MALKRMSIKVSEELYDWVASEAETRGLTMNAVVIFALETYQKEKMVLPNMNSLKDLVELIQVEQQKEDEQRK